MAPPDKETSRGGKSFVSKEGLENLVGEWPGKQLVEFWNQIPGVKSVRKFTDRKTAIDRIWNALQQSPSQTAVSTTGPECANQAERIESRKTNGDRGTTRRTRSVQPGSKKDVILKLLSRPSSVTLEKLMRVTGWQAHSVRGFISAGVNNVNKRLGLRVTSNRREDGQRVYQIR